VRQLKIYPVEGAATLLHCSDCEWQYRFENCSALLDDIEKDQGTFGFSRHNCADFPPDEIRAKAS
jgi:hypothetical protein